ncbi:MAG: DNA-binding response regulator [Acidobacteria bacterium]|nr:MAG: DNA-binding response regulator [Acidobacteriota bacterium]MCL4286705.1 response regulator transcription factor [Thermoleophilia bacterium]GIK76774.1 MAG: putative nitrate/nitrite response transcriptional regulatory protein NarL [Actinomycetes bacterium]
MDAPADKGPVTVTVADGSPLFRIGLVAVLEQDGIAVGDQASDAGAAITAIDRCRPDVSVVDLDLPELGGLAVLEAVRGRAGAPRMLLLAPGAESQPLYRALSLGAAGYLAKRSEADRVCAAVRAIAAGATVIDERLQSGLADEIRLREHGDRPILTDREREVLTLAAEGASVADAAGRLHLSDATIKTHLHHAYAKLEVSDRAAAVARALRHGLIE